LTARGLTGGAIAEHLFLGNQTVQTHTGCVFAKTGSASLVATIACTQRHINS
jgi:DNA-binding NarL/FixJ family response regulator